MAMVVGLIVAWLGTAFLISPPAVRAFGDPSNLPMAFVGQAVLWTIAAAVIAIVLFWERRPLASLWLKPFRRQSIAWGVALVAVNFVAISPIGEWVRHAAGLPGFSQGMERVMAFPLSYRIVAFIGAGVVEELLFRGYTITRLATLTGNVWLAGALAVIGFGLLHVSSWGWGFVVSGLVGGVVFTTFFIWKKDLLAMMVFHTITDAIGIVISPAFSEWWKEYPLPR